ncbi:hypothetical protein CEE36_10105 [candidate division TA06 bacterium B3_TA06]|uniref:Uncharacterized protein n=1 Tax=candidate division TA06 bacterium B3_TA06 TaxID=2012487 RepID=A0A532UY62_UNCT6|nr:MAG: hypothetical protein CEE36_10105 [candidate division TA06 bacterium B3_TA06]
MRDVYLPDEVPRDVVEKLFVSARGEPYIKYRRALNMVYDVSTWKPGKDVVKFYAWRREYDTVVWISWDTGDSIGYEVRELFPQEQTESATLFLYPWHGEDTISYQVSSWSLRINGKQAGILFRPIESMSFLPEEKIELEYIDAPTQGIVTITIEDFEPPFTIRRLERFPDLEVIFMTLYFEDYAYEYYRRLTSDLIRYKERCWLSKWLYFRGLKQVTEIADLYLYIEGVRDAELWFLRNFNKLKGLWIESDSITDAGLKHLAKLSGLRTLDLYETEVSEEGVAELREALPECKITFR